MAFFGLSALGPQNTFVAARPETYNCSLFELEEFAEAFDRTDKQKSGSLDLEQVEKALELVFHGPLPAYERGRVMDAFSSLCLPSVPRDLFLQTIDELRRDEEQKPLDLTHTAHYNSFDEMRAERLRQRRPSQGPADLYTKPLTSISEVGWKAKDADLHEERHFRVSCAETKFMGALFKAGVI